MLRVVLGRARPDTEWSGKISGLRFNSAPGAQESARSRDVTSTILTVPRSHHEQIFDVETDPLDGEEGVGERNAATARV
jgi:hypothetical protein